MRVIEIEFVRDVKYGPPGGGVKTKSLFRSPEHTMLWLPTEGTFVIDGWRVLPGEGTRWRVEMAPVSTLPGGTTQEKLQAINQLAGVVGHQQADQLRNAVLNDAVRGRVPTVPEETDGAAQPGQPGRPARGKKQRG